VLITHSLTFQFHILNLPIPEQTLYIPIEKKD